ncbi:MAG: glycosyltransferase family 39 protein [Desulfovibrio sp.]|nr:glycosyltransferase family 39 protein [Desulfovibrio sp.]MBI4961607.1 glycosyltransferase family 39 protein [Desulfovibrio sp.]
MIKRAQSNGYETVWFGRVFLFVLLVASALRLWKLEVPSLWFDEVLVAMVAKLPVWSIFQRSMAEDFHPPTFYLLTKLVMTAGLSDFVLRLPQVAFGVTGVWFAWRAGREMLSEGSGLLLASLTAVQPWHVLLSRQLRPYSIVFLFSFMSFFFLWRAIKEGKAKDFLLAGFALWPPVLLHFSGLLAVGGAGLIMLCAWARGRIKFSRFLLFCLVSGMGVACVIPYFVALIKRERAIAGGAGYPEVAGVTLEKLGELFFRDALVHIRLGLAVLIVIGASTLFKRNKLLGFISLGWFTFPLLALVAARYSDYFNPWHLMFLLPPVLIWKTQAVRSLAGERAIPWLACAFAIIGGIWYLFPVRESYYSAASYSGDYKDKAQRILGKHKPGLIYVYKQNGEVGPLNWYLDQFATSNPLRAQRLVSHDGVVILQSSDTGSQQEVLTREPVISLINLPFKQRITAAPHDFMTYVHRMEYVACQPVLEDILIATEAGRTGFAEFTFENYSNVPQRIVVHFGYSNRRAGNRFGVQCRFDDEPYADSFSFESVGPDMRGHEKIELVRDRPYRFLTLRFELFRDGSFSAFTGEDTDGVRFLDFSLQSVSEK